MKRRSVVTGFGWVTALAVAGCLDRLSGSSRENQGFLEMPDNPDEVPLRSRELQEREAHDFSTAESVEVGDMVNDLERGETSSSVEVNNIGGDSLLDVGIINVTTEEVVFERQFDVPTDHTAKVFLNISATHIAHVRISETGYMHEVRIPEEVFAEGGGRWLVDIIDSNEIESSYIAYDWSGP